MSVYKYLFSRDSLHRKILDIKDEIISIVGRASIESFRVDWYGEYKINPKNLVFWICVESDSARDKLRSNSVLNAELRQLLETHGYPVSARNDVYIGFESQETVSRDSNGDWFRHFK